MILFGDVFKDMDQLLFEAVDPPEYFTLNEKQTNEFMDNVSDRIKDGSVTYNGSRFFYKGILVELANNSGLILG